MKETICGGDSKLFFSYYLIFAIEMMSENTPAAVTLAPAPISFDYHRIFVVAFGRDHDDVVAAFKIVEWVSFFYLAKSHLAFSVVI